MKDENQVKSVAENKEVEDALIDEEIKINQEMTFIEKVIKKKDSLTFKQKFAYSFIAIVAIGMSLFHVYTSLRGTLPAWQHRAVHLCIGLILAYAIYPLNKKKGFRLIDLLPLVIVLVIFAYVLIDYPGQELRIGDPNQMDIVLGSLLMLLLIEATRRTNGWPMALVCALFIVYIFTGPMFPGLLGHQGYRYTKMIDQMFNGTVGIFGTPLYVSSTVLILFVIWGAFLMKSGAGEFFTNISLALTGHKRGGPALAAVLSSALVGSITGNGAANVAITGSFTIPLMKKTGYRADFAAAVEAVASQGGQLMPPIMGAAAFIMAEYVGIPYIKIAGFAAIPAILYFIIAGVIIYLQARKRGLGGMNKDELPNGKEVFKKGFYFFLPIIFIVIMMAKGNSPMKAGFWAIIMTIALSYIDKPNKLGLLDIFNCLERGARAAVPVIIACAAAGIIVGSISLTGLGIRFSRLAVDIAGGNLFLMLFMIMVASIVLGMGMPTSSAYIILAVLGTPPLIKLGVNVVAAHLFVLYFGVISGLTPPVAITAYTAAGIAESNPTRTAILSTKIGIGGFLLPFAFVLNPELLLQTGNVLVIIQVLFTSFVGCIAFAVFVQGYLFTSISIFQRIGFFIASMFLIQSHYITDIIGFGMLALLIVLNLKKSKRDYEISSEEESLSV